jgi:uncharacterized membrane protein
VWTVQTRLGWTLLLLGALLVVLTSARYFTLNPEVYFPRQREVYEAHTLALMAHIAAMMVAALLGPFQFLRSYRDRYRRAHRVSGRIYLLSALVGGLSGLYLAQHSASGVVSDLGFAALALGVLAASAIAFLRIRGGHVQSHREWMTRSYALIFGAVTLRLYLPFLDALLGERHGYALVAWLAWVPNLLVAEWLIRGPLRAHAEPPLTNTLAA